MKLIEKKEQWERKFRSAEKKWETRRESLYQVLFYGFWNHLMDVVKEKGRERKEKIMKEKRDLNNCRGNKKKKAPKEKN